jgi:hypothetical protein
LCSAFCASIALTGHTAQILALGGTMYFQKLSSLGLAVLASISLVAPSVTLRPQPGPDPQCSGTSTKTWVADGGAPVPSYPPPPPKRSVSINSQPTLLADGGAPVPSYPPPPPKRSFSANSQPALVADGGAPVPPYPPKPSNAKFLAV